MAEPAVTQPSPQFSQGGGPNAGVTFDEIEDQLKAAERAALAPKLDDSKLDGEEVPEAFRGKTVREVLAHTKALEDTLDVDIFSPPRQDWLDKTDDYLRRK